jgi:hypothetical protein
MAISITKRMSEIYDNELDYYMSLKGTEYLKFVDRDLNQSLAIYNELIRMATNAGQTELVKQLEPKFRKYEAAFMGSQNARQ